MAQPQWQRERRALSAGASKRAGRLLYMFKIWSDPVLKLKSGPRRTDGAEARDLTVPNLGEDLGGTDLGLLVIEHEGERHLRAQACGATTDCGQRARDRIRSARRGHEVSKCPETSKQQRTVAHAR